MKKLSFVIVIAMAISLAFVFSSCSYTSKTMKTPNNYVEFEKSDFEFSQQLTGEGTETRILGVDWTRLFKREIGTIESATLSIPIIGNLPMGGSQAYALFDLMEKNPGYDVVFYPQYETKITGFPILFQTSKTTVKARLAKIK